MLQKLPVGIQTFEAIIGKDYFPQRHFQRKTRPVQRFVD
jgi:hypothetical protein